LRERFSEDVHSGTAPLRTAGLRPLLEHREPLVQDPDLREPPLPGGVRVGKSGSACRDRLPRGFVAKVPKVAVAGRGAQESVIEIPRVRVMALLEVQV